MTHSFELLTKSQDWECLRPIMEGLSTQLPLEGTGVIAVEFDEMRKPVAFQVMQNILCFEGLYAKDGDTNLRRLWNMLFDYLAAQANGNIAGRSVFTIATSEKMERVAKLMGAEAVPDHWRLMRRIF